MQFYRQQSAEMYVLVHVILTVMISLVHVARQNFVLLSKFITHIHTTYSHTFTQHTHIHTHTDNWMEVRRSSDVILCF